MFFFRLSVSVLFTNLPSPSTALRNTFPVKPSVTSMSISPENASLPSTFPYEV